MKHSMQITIQIGGKGSLSAELEDNPAARDCASLRPLALTLQDYTATEKISDLPRRLSTVDAPVECNAEAA